MVKDAEAAGFNPLTALRSGGSAGFSVTSQPVLSSTHAAIGDAIGGIGNFLANFDPMADDKREQEYRLVQAQIANLNASSDAFRSQSFNVPTYTAGKVEQRPSGRAAQLSPAARVGAATLGPQEPAVEAPTLTNPWQEMVIDRYARDAAAFEQRYGGSELAETAAGLQVFTKDMYQNIRRFMTSPKGTYVKVKKLPENERSWWPKVQFNWDY